MKNSEYFINKNYVDYVSHIAPKTKEIAGMMSPAKGCFTFAQIKPSTTQMATKMPKKKNKIRTPTVDVAVVETTGPAASQFKIFASMI